MKPTAPSDPDTPAPSNPDDTTGTSDLPPPTRQASRLKRTVLHSILGLFLMAGLFSLWVAFRQPDAQETVILGQSRLAIDSPAAIRVFVRHRLHKTPVPRARVHLTLVNAANKEFPLGRFRTDRNGTLSEPLEIPDLRPGEYTLNIEAESRLGEDRISRKIHLHRPSRILLSTDKPVYQPGQTLHLRALLANSRTRKPEANRSVTFEVFDPKDNKVFKQSAPTSRFGIVSADFQLADEINHGAYRVTASSDNAQTEQLVEVKRYVLPKFKIEVTTDKSWYRPGETVTGTVHARYFFEKPVADADVETIVSLSRPYLANHSVLHGTTDANGRHEFRFTIPVTPVSHPSGELEVAMNVKVTDSAGQKRTTTLSRPITTNGLQFTAVPEVGELVLGVRNLIYLLATDPDGSPASCTVTVNSIANGSIKHGTSSVPIPTTFTLGASGTGFLTVTPTNPHFRLELTARNREGKAVHQVLELQDRPFAGPPTVLLRPDKAVYRPGEAVGLSILTAVPHRVLFVDLKQDGQTVASRSIKPSANYAHIQFPIPEGINGRASFFGYIFDANGREQGHNRMIYIQPVGDLSIQTWTDKDVYRPGETANLDIAITDASGRPSPAALGLVAVDEAVYGTMPGTPLLTRQMQTLMDSSMATDGALSRPQEAPTNPTSLSQEIRSMILLAQAHSEGTQQSLIQKMTTADSHSQRLVEDLIDPAKRLHYEQYRDDPRFAKIFRLLESGPSAPPLWISTGPAKEIEVNRFRRAYFDRLKKVLIGLLLSLPVLSVVFLVSTNRRSKILSQLHAHGRVALVYKYLFRRHQILATLTCLPLALYTLGAWAIHEITEADVHLLALISIELFVVIASVLGLHSKERRIRRIAEKCGTPPLPGLPLAFLTVVFTSRFLMALYVGSLHQRLYLSNSAFIVWLLLSLLAPLLIVAFSAYDLAQYQKKYFLPGYPRRISAASVAVILSIFIVLGGMLLPALAKAKARSQRVSFLSDLKQMELAIRIAENENLFDRDTDADASDASPRIRRHFPETLYWQPHLITDDEGKASVEIPLADSITTWRASFDAISMSGAMGEGGIPIRVFQDFFVDLDLPVSLSLDDEITVPVACYNYLDSPQTIALRLNRADWFESVSEPAKRPRRRSHPGPMIPVAMHRGAAPEPDANAGVFTRTSLWRPETGDLYTAEVALEPGEVRSVPFRIRAREVGTQKLLVEARGSGMSDAIERAVRVLPTGRQVTHTFNEILEGRWMGTFDLLPEAIPNSESLVLKFHPSRFSEVLEGLDGIFQAPHGCFEQTSSTTYPNVMALDYLTRMDRLTPGIGTKARQYISQGYQRLLPFEVEGGGFSLYGHAPADVWLSAYAILEFSDMSRVHSVDPKIIERTARWLEHQQDREGSWLQRTHRHPAGDDRTLLTTAYVTWSLAEADACPEAKARALRYLELNLDKLDSTYVRALAANAFLARDPNSSTGRMLVEQLAREAKPEGGQHAYWNSEGHSITRSYGKYLQVETTALCTLALIKRGQSPQLAKQALGWLSAQKRANGAFGSTQATVLAMRALLAGTGRIFGSDQRSNVTIRLNNKPIRELTVDQTNSDVLHQVSLTPHLKPGVNFIEVTQEPKGELPLQIVGEYWTRKDSRAGHARDDRGTAATLTIRANYSHTYLTTEETLEVKVTAANAGQRPAVTPLIELGVPPGFHLEPDAFEKLLAARRIEKFEIKGARVHLYLDRLEPGEAIEFTYRMQAAQPLRVRTPKAAIYEYYNPDNRAESGAAIVRVTGSGG